MPFKDKARRSQYQIEWVLKRRAEWFASNGPCRVCRSWEELQVDHIDESVKVSHRIWSWRDERRENELAKCQVLCKECHQAKSSASNSQRNRGVPRLNRRIVTDDQINLAVELVDAGASIRSVERLFGVGHCSLRDGMRRKVMTA